MAQNKRLSWRTTTPGHVVFLIDLSESMGWENGTRIKFAMNALYQCLTEMLDLSRKAAEYLPRFTYSIIGYNSDIIYLSQGGVNELESLLMDAEERGTLFDLNGWLAKPQGKKYMADAFRAAKKDIEQWISAQNSASIPTPAPLVINITDGRPEESGKTKAQAMAEAEAAASELRSIRVPDGALSLFNIHINPKESYQEVVFPDSISACPEENSQFLFRISSCIPEEGVVMARDFLKMNNLSSKNRGLLSNTRINLIDVMGWGLRDSLPLYCEIANISLAK